MLEYESSDSSDSSPSYLAQFKNKSLEVKNTPTSAIKVLNVDFQRNLEPAFSEDLVKHELGVNNYQKEKCLDTAEHELIKIYDKSQNTNYGNLIQENARTNDTFSE